MRIYQLLFIKSNSQISQLNKQVNPKKVSQLVKWVFDRLCAAIALAVFSPVILMVAIAIYLRMGRPIVFTQPRPGKNGEVFQFYKFRTMTSDRDADGNLLPDVQRITAIGKFLRQTSLDELPQLWNVLKGDMSFVGPRPLLVEYLERYSPEQARRHEVKPGITGWAQINGRNAISWPEKFNLDVWYVDRWSLWLDFQILLLTPIEVIKHRGISHPNQATMNEFLGNMKSNE
ncbi:sugar transferase [Microcoleus sp. Pol12B4]|uniref:sugar transferase n=1 Tax=Microcoleus sp. Pol12B4 TaxID=3055395 RepID=UPI002FD71849